MQSLLDQLKEMTVVVADTGDFHSIEKYRPRDATTNPSLLANAAQMTAYSSIVDETLADVRRDVGPSATPQQVVHRAIDQLAVEFGQRILKIVPGRVSTEVDARLSFDTKGTIEKARHLIGLYEKDGISRNRILIKIASTWEGIRAAETLEKEGIHCNLTLLFGLHQAIACAEGGITLISPFVGRILDWHKKKSGRASYPGPEDPGVVSVARIHQYYKHFGYKTEVMGASFRNIDEIIELAGCDLLTISPQLLEELSKKDGTLTKKLDADAAKKANVERIAMDEPTFRKMHEADAMAKDKLAEGIEGFTKSLVQLEKQLQDRLDDLETQPTAVQ